MMERVRKAHGKKVKEECDRAETGGGRDERMKEHRAGDGG